MNNKETKDRIRAILKATGKNYTIKLFRYENNRIALKRENNTGILFENLTDMLIFLEMYCDNDMDF